MTMPAGASVQPWKGGRCPVAADAQVRVFLRYAPPRTGRAADFSWSHDLYYAYGAEDVIAYEVLIDPAENGA
jgi:hypothetical protein